jgi:hypothetical protein
MAYRPVPIPPDFSAPDLTIGQAMAFLQLSARSVQRLCALGHLDSFVLAGSRRIVFDSVKAYRQACIDRGPMLSQRPTTGKRRPGRPKRPDEQATAE